VGLEPPEEVEVEAERQARRDAEIAGAGAVVVEPEARAEADVKAQTVVRAVPRLPEVVGVEAVAPAARVEAIAAGEAAEADAEPEIDGVGGSGPDLRRHPGRGPGHQPEADGPLDPHLGGRGRARAEPRDHQR